MSERMGQFWDARAREDALFFIDDRRRYRDPELASFWAAGAADLQQIQEMLDLHVGPKDVVLDVGCGVGRLTRAIAAQAAEVYGLDVSREMLERARRLNSEIPNVRWVQGDGRSLSSIADCSIDLCISHVVFQHIPDPKITLGYVREIGRVLRPGGVAGFQVSNDPAVHKLPRLSRRMKSRLGALVGLPSGREDPAWLGAAVDLDDLRAVAANAGLELQRVIGEGTQFCLIRARRL